MERTSAPVWSPDGKRLALAYFERMPYETSFHVLDTVTRQVVAIPFTPANLPDTWSPWSPDGTKLMLGAMGRTMIVDVANNPARLVREVTGYLRNIHWSPDGTKLAYEYGKEGVLRRCLCNGYSEGRTEESQCWVPRISLLSCVPAGRQIPKISPSWDFILAVT